MSGKVSGMVWELDIPHGHAWVLMSLADHAEHDGSQVFPGNGLTAWKTGYSVSQIKRILRDLMRKYGLVEVVASGGGRSTTEYRICLENFARHKKPEMPARGPKKGNQHAAKPEPKEAAKTNRVHYDPGSSDPSPPGSSTRAHDDGNVIKETSRRDADASPGPKNWFSVYCDRAQEVGLSVSDEDRGRIPGNLTRCMMRDEATDHEMFALIGQMVSRRRRGVVLSPQEALNDVRGIPTPPRQRGQSEQPRIRSEEV